MVKKMTPYWFNWIKDDRLDIGFVAQEMKSILPYVVVSSDSGLLSIDYGRITTVIVSAIHNIDTEISLLKEEISRLNDRLLELENGK